MEKLFDILHEDDGLLVINKPAGLACHPTKKGPMSSLISRVRLHLGDAAKAHLINRLDRETSGVVLVAKNDEAARELRKLWETRVVQKEYRAIVHGRVRDERGVIDAPLGKDEHSEVAIKNCVRADGAAARTEFAVLRRFTRAEGEFTLLHVTLHTGRKHQIRIHLAHFGHPIVGDKLYGGDEMLYLDFVKERLTEEQRCRLILENQALHARAVRFAWRERPWEFIAEPEPWFAEFAPNDALSPRAGAVLRV
ncbi:MAG: RluA family pseudouridine synthase [Verrucomicrobia bacterium]|nr:RluA family pseudouridine synthase [Verrucomicrobiota bacterium]